MSLSYLRPDQGVTIIPWLYSLLLLLVHLPLAFTRIIQWEKSQWFSIGVAFFTIALTCQSYVATGLSTENIYVWFPVAMTGDIGGALQLIILISRMAQYQRRKSVRFWLKRALMTIRALYKLMLHRTNARNEIWQPQDVELPLVENSSTGRSLPPFNFSETTESPLLNFDEDIENAATISVGSLTATKDQEIQTDTYPEEDETVNDHLVERRESSLPTHVMPWQFVVVLVLASSILITLFILQGVGLVYSVLRYIELERENAPFASFCSPAFVLGGDVFVQDSACHSYSINPKADRGTGCILLPGDQKPWLLATIIALSVELFLEVGDCFILLRGKSQRPWLTMSVGLIVWSLLIGFGVMRSNMLPLPNPVVGILAANETACTTQLASAGLRGSIIGWSDGIFDWWNTTYFGGDGAGNTG